MEIYNVSMPIIMEKNTTIETVIDYYCLYHKTDHIPDIGKMVTWWREFVDKYQETYSHINTLQYGLWSISTGDYRINDVSRYRREGELDLLLWNRNNPDRFYSRSFASYRYFTGHLDLADFILKVRNKEIKKYVSSLEAEFAEKLEAYVRECDAIDLQIAKIKEENRLHELEQEQKKAESTKKLNWFQKLFN